MPQRHVPPNRVIARLARRCVGCGKVIYLNRRDAMEEWRQFRGSGMNAYPRPANPDVFHLGHLPPLGVHAALVAGADIRAIAS